MLHQPLHEVGVFDVAIKLHAEVEATLKVWIVEEKMMRIPPHSAEAERGF